MNFWRSQLTTLQIAVLFVYSALLCLAFAGIFALNAWTLWRADLLEYVPDFGMAALLCVSSPLGMTVALLRFHSARRTNSGMSRFALFFALVAVVCGVLALRLTPFAFGRVAVAAFLLTFLFTEASVRISGITRSWFVAFAILLGSATLLVTFIEGLLVTQYLNARFPEIGSPGLWRRGGRPNSRTIKSESGRSPAPWQRRLRPGDQQCTRLSQRA